MQNSRFHINAIPSPDNLGFPIRRKLKNATCHIGNLRMGMRMRRTDRSRFKFHFHHHQITIISHDLTLHTSTEILPSYFFFKLKISTFVIHKFLSINSCSGCKDK